MTIKNINGFVPKGSPIQPSYYRNIFNGWCAIFFDDKDREFQLQLVLDPWAWQNGYKHARALEILMQTPTHRVQVCPGQFKTIKAALEKLESLLLNDTKSA
jgi:hypothetical protein